MPTRVWRVLRAHLPSRRGHLEEPLPRNFSAADESPEAPGDAARIAEYYANLELPYGANADAVRAARRLLLKRYHPDRFAADPARAAVAHRLVQHLNDAHDELLLFLARSTHD